MTELSINDLALEALHARRDAIDKQIAELQEAGGFDPVHLPHHTGSIDTCGFKAKPRKTTITVTDIRPPKRIKARTWTPEQREAQRKAMQRYWKKTKKG